MQQPGGISRRNGIARTNATQDLSLNFIGSEYVDQAQIDMSRIGRGRRGVENDFSAARAGALRGKRHRGPGNLQLKKENRRTAQAFGRCLDIASIDAIIRPGNYGNEILPTV